MEDERDIPMEDVSGEADIVTDEVPFFPGDDPIEPSEIPSEQKPKRAKKSHNRQDASEVLALAWGGLGKGMEKADQKGMKFGSYPTGRAMQIQSVVAGNHLDALVKGTWLDRLLVQPLARMLDTAEGSGALFALPVLIYAIDKKPALAAPAEPYLRAVFYQTIEDMEPVIKRQQAAQEKQIRAARSAGEMFGTEGADPFQAFMDYLFSPPGQEPVVNESFDPEPAEQPARKARPRRTAS